MTDYLSGYDNGWRDALKDKKERAKATMSPEHQAVVDENLALRNEIDALKSDMDSLRTSLQGEADEVDRLNAIIHSPESNDFIKGVSIEAEFQRQKHGVDTSDGRYDWHQWFWVVGYLMGKALAACKSGEGDGEKARHHLITTAALLNNWHNVLTGKPAASVNSNAGAPVAAALDTST